MIEQCPRPAELAEAVFQGFDAVLAEHHPELKAVEIGTVISVDRGTARLNGLPSVEADELLEFRNGILGMAFNLDANEVGVILLDDSEQLQAGSQARRTGRLLDVPVGKELLGRVIDPVGRPLDQKPSLETALRRPVERDAPPIMDRAPVTVPLHTGLKVVDALIPVGRGQRELILGDRQTGKSALAIDTILNQRGRDVICIYCSIAQRTSGVARVVAELRESSALEPRAMPRRVCNSWLLTPRPRLANSSWNRGRMCL